MLLNPKGEHKHGAKFLELFLQKLEIKEFVTKNAIVSIERYAHGRRIDISIESQNRLIIIENKVWAIDQPRQLIDYYNYGIGTGKQVCMIYLTPYGRLPSYDSLGNGELPQEKITCISYEKHILEWLEDCLSALSESKNMRLKLSLEMYVELVRNVIKRDKYMNEIMSNLMSNPKNMELAIDIVKSLVGRDFMSYPNVLEDFKSQIKKVADGLVDNPYYYIESKYAAELDLQNEDNSIGSICLDNAEIFVVNSDDKPSLPEFTIRTYDINDSNLQNLLTHNFEGIYEWMEQIVDRLKAIKK